MRIVFDQHAAVGGKHAGECLHRGPHLGTILKQIVPVVDFLALGIEFCKAALDDAGLGRLEGPFLPAEQVDHSERKVGEAQDGDGSKCDSGKADDAEQSHVRSVGVDFGHFPRGRQEILKRPLLVVQNREGVAGKGVGGNGRYGNGRFRTPFGYFLGCGSIHDLHTGWGETEAEVGFQRGIHIRTKSEQEQIGIDEFERCAGGGEGVAEIGGSAHSSMLERADQTEICMLVEERQGREPWVLKDGHEGFSRRGLDRLGEAHDSHQRSAQGMGDDWKVRAFARLSQRGDQGGVLAGQSDCRADHLTAGGGVGQNAPWCLVGKNGRVFDDRNRVVDCGVAELGQRSGIVQLGLEFHCRELVRDVEDDA